MKLLPRFRTLLLLSILPVLASCADGFDLSARGPIHSEFSRTLDAEYQTLADYEEKNQNDTKLAGYFRRKADKARAGDQPLPDDPAKTDLKPPVLDELAQAHDKLLSSLAAGDWVDNGPILGLAQTRYDCWLALEATYGLADSGFGCRQKYEEAMDMLARSKPIPRDAVYTILFNSNSIGITEDGMKAVRDAAGLVRAQPDWLAVLTGYTDTKENEENSRNLSMRRAMSVRNALAQQGVPSASIRVDAFGKAPEGRQGVPDQERRVDIRVMTKAAAASLPPSHIQDLLPENFGSQEPVF